MKTTYKTLTDRQPVPLTSDFVFKYVFGATSTEILRSLLSAVQEDAGYPAVATVQIVSTPSTRRTIPRTSSRWWT